MIELNELVAKALKINGIVEEGKLTVESNGGVVFYFIGDDECTASQAIDYLEK